jgi:deoxyguanosine kinase
MNSPEYEHPYIAISGPMGIGKTTVAKLVADRFEYYLLEENFAANPFVAKAAADRDRYAFHSEVFFLMEKYGQIIVAQERLKDKGVVQDTPIQQDVYSYGQALLQGPEWNTYHNLYQALEPRLMKPSLIVCLEANAEVHMERIRHRGRDFENAVTPDYLKQLTEFNYEWIRKSGIPTVYIQTDHLDIVNTTGAKITMMDQIRSKLQSMNYKL